LPIVSGRDYRVRTCSVSALHERYQKLCQQSPFGYCTFRKYLKTLKVRKSYLFPCPTCENFRILSDKVERTAEEEKKLNKCEVHAARIPVQRRAYLRQREGLQAGELMIVMNFSKFDYITHKFQDLIVCFYRKGDVGGCYEHFVGETDQRNDCHFVFYVWNYFIEKGYFLNVSKIYLWSDGGPKHLKLTGFLNFLSAFVDSLEHKLTIEYNFFVSRTLRVQCLGCPSKADGTEMDRPKRTLH
jgi:hypothetical protein